VSRETLHEEHENSEGLEPIAPRQFDKQGIVCASIEYSRQSLTAVID
jgi:hypothetical protein